LSTLYIAVFVSLDVVATFDVAIICLTTFSKMMLSIHDVIDSFSLWLMMSLWSLGML